MPRFICFQRSVPTESTEPDAADGPSMADFEVEFTSWMATYGDNLLDMGGPFGQAEMALPDGASKDPANNVNGIAGGYMILTADDLEAAVAIARSFPGLVRPGSGVEVVEIRES